MSAPTATHIATAVTDHLPGIQRLAREYGVARLEVYGDAAEGELPHDRFSISFIVTYPDGYEFGPWGGRFTELYEALGKMVSREIHLLMSTTDVENEVRRANIDETRTTIYIGA